MFRNASFVVTTIASIAMSTQAPAQQSVRIGIILPMSGYLASIGAKVSAGTKLYTDTKQRCGPAGGKTIEIIFRDDHGQPAEAVQYARELTEREKVVAILGGATSLTAKAIASIVTSARTPTVILTSEGLAVDASPYFVRTSFSQTQFSMALATWAAKNGIKSISTILPDNEIGTRLSSSFKISFERAGGKIIEQHKIVPSNDDFTSFISQSASSNIDATFLSPSYVQSFLHQLAGHRNDRTKILSVGDLIDDEQLKGINEGAIGLVTAQMYWVDRDSSSNKDFVSAFEAKHRGNKPDSFAVDGYDAIHLLCDAEERANGTSDGDVLIRAIQGLTWESPRGRVTIDPKTRDIVQDMYILRAENVGGTVKNVKIDTISSDAMWCPQCASTYDQCVAQCNGDQACVTNCARYQ